MRERVVPIGTLVLAMLALLLYAGTVGNLSGAQETDAAGRGMAVAFGALFAAALFVVIAALLLVAVAKGRMSLAATLAAIVLVPAAVAAIWIAAEAYVRGNTLAIWVPGLLPPLFVAYALRARFAPLRALMSEWIANIMMLAACAVLIGVPIFRQVFPPPPDVAAEARAAAEFQVREEQERRRFEEEKRQKAEAFAKLGPDSSLADYMPYRNGDLSNQAFAGMKQVKSRQADIVVLLGSLPLHDVPALTELDLQPTAELCQAYGTALANAAGGVSPTARSDYITAAIELEYERPTMRWLVGAGCNLDRPLGILESNLRAVADSPRLTKFADELAALRSRRP